MFTKTPLFYIFKEYKKGSSPISIKNDLQNAEVIDVLGNVVLPLGKLYTGKNTIDVTSLAAGMYFIAVRDADKLFSKRFVKQD